ncbi:MAG: Uma2 family endonuclease [Cyanobacteria bacterium J06560_2]
MTASLVNLPKQLSADEQRLRLDGVTWKQYDALVTLFMDQFPALRMTYLKGALEIVSTSAEHERLKKIIARLIEAFAEEADLNLNGYGAATFREKAAERGLEPDECYVFGDLEKTPDIAVEIVLTSGGIEKLAVYQGLDVQEVWFWENQRFSVYSLINPTEGYEAVESSRLLPTIDLSLLSQFVGESNQTKAVRAFRQALRKELKQSA